VVRCSELKGPKPSPLPSPRGLIFTHVSDRLERLGLSFDELTAAALNAARAAFLPAKEREALAGRLASASSEAMPLFAEPGPET